MSRTVAMYGLITVMLIMSLWMTRTVAMWLIVPVMMIMSMWPAVTTAQETCAVDADCMSSQFCNISSLTCADTLCSSYNRKESSEPSRTPSTCGRCVEGYSRERSIKSTPGAYRCTGDYQELWEVLSVFGPLIILSIILIHYTASYCCRTDGAATQVNNLDLEMVGAGISIGSAPPIPSSIPEINKREHDDVVTNPVPTIGTQVSSAVDNGCRHARAFHPPYYVKIDPNYDPDIVDE